MAEDQIIDLESLPLHELKALAEKEAQENAAAAASTVTDPADKVAQPRGEDGKFKAVRPEDYDEDETKVVPRTAKLAKVEEVEEPEEEEIVFYRREVKNADGSVDVYEDESLEGLLDKIADGKANANTKIRQQEIELKELRARTAQKPKTKEYTADDDYVYQQEFLKSPTAAFKKMFKDMTGRDIAEFGTIAEREQIFQQAEATNNALASFIATHTDYEDSVRNSEAMKLALQGKETTGENLHKAYLHLKQSRLLDLKGEEAHVDTEPKSKTTEPTVQPKTEVTQQRTKKGSGVRTQSRVAPVTSNEPSEDDLYDPAKYSLDEIKRRALADTAKSNR